MRLIFFRLAILLLMAGPAGADTAPSPSSLPAIPGIDFSKPGPSPSPSGAGMMSRRPPSKKRRTVPAVGVGAAGDNQGYAAGEGKVRVGF